MCQSFRTAGCLLEILWKKFLVSWGSSEEWGRVVRLFRHSYFSQRIDVPSFIVLFEKKMHPTKKALLFESQF